MLNIDLLQIKKLLLLNKIGARSYKIDLRKMMSHFKSLTRKYFNKFFCSFKISNLNFFLQRNRDSTFKVLRVLFETFFFFAPYGLFLWYMYTRTWNYTENHSSTFHRDINLALANLSTNNHFM